MYGELQYYDTNTFEIMKIFIESSVLFCNIKLLVNGGIEIKIRHINNRIGRIR